MYVPMHLDAEMEIQAAMRLHFSRFLQTLSISIDERNDIDANTSDCSSLLS